MTDPVLVLREALAKATEGPWEVQREGCDCGGHYPCGHGDYPYAIRVPEAAHYLAEKYDPIPEYAYLRSEISEFTDADVDLIVAARNLLPVLLDEVEALRKKHAGLLDLYERHTVALQEERDDAKDEAEELRKVVEQVRALHVADTSRWCSCDEPKPCETVRLLAVLDKEEEK